MYYRWSIDLGALARVPQRLESQVFFSLIFFISSSSCHRLFASCFSDSSIERHACKSASERNEFASHTRLYRSCHVCFSSALRTFLKGVKVDRPVIYKVSPFSRTRYINFCIDSNKTIINL